MGPLIAVVASLTGCGKIDETAAVSSTEPSTTVPEVGVPALGGGTGDLAAVTRTVVVTAADGLNVPRDLDFNPKVEDELWIINRADDSVTIARGAGTSDQATEHIIDPYAFHFMEEVSSISFGAVTHDGSDWPTFGTCQETNNTYDGHTHGDDFMGPTLWSSDPEIFGKSNPDAVAYLSNLYGFYVDLGSHLDMLHESPWCMGIAWEVENVYWVYDGNDGSIVRYDFQVDHGPGFDDHSDGIAARYVTGEMAGRTPDVPSHLVYDHDAGVLYIADTGAGVIWRLDPSTATRGATLFSTEPGTDHHEMEGATLDVFIDGAAAGIELPSGIELVDGVLLVGDHATGVIHAFDADGALIDALDTGVGAGALMGLRARSLEDIWFVDGAANEVIRLQPLE